MPTQIAHEEVQVRDNDTNAISAFTAKVVDAVDRAYRYVHMNPWLGPYALLDGHTERWTEVWGSFLLGGRVNLPAAAFGYVVESISTMIHLKDPPDGMAIILQGVRGATRPDIILTKGGADVAWIDITASNSKGHIWNKIGWRTQVNYVAEVTYPSVEVASLNRNPFVGSSDEEDENEVYERILFAKWLHKERRAKWKERGKLLFAGYPKSYINILRDESRRKDAIGVLANYFTDVPVEEIEPVAASLVLALGKIPKSHGFQLGFYVSRAEGESFLLQHDPNLLTLEMQKIAIPRPVGMPLQATPPWKLPTFTLSEPSSDSKELVPFKKKKFGTLTKPKVGKPKRDTIAGRIRFMPGLMRVQDLLGFVKEGLVDNLADIVGIELITRRGNSRLLRRFRGRVPSAQRSLTSGSSEVPLTLSLPMGLPFQMQWSLQALSLPETEEEQRQVQQRAPETPPLSPSDTVIGIGIQWNDGVSELMLVDPSAETVLPQLQFEEDEEMENNDP